jgi:ATP-dependent Clp protease ATP-binding subunit ClpA
MFEPYSIRARRVIFVARHLAGRAGAHAIRTDHIILALIYEDQDRVQEALEQPDLFLTSEEPAAARTAFFAPEVAAKLIQDFKTLIGTGEPLPTHVDMPLTLEAKRMLGSAHALAGVKAVVPLHLLAAALGETDSSGNGLLREAGVEKEAVLKAIQEP